MKITSNSFHNFAGQLEIYTMYALSKMDAESKAVIIANKIIEREMDKRVMIKLGAILDAVRVEIKANEYISAAAGVLIILLMNQKNEDLNIDVSP